MEFLKELFGGEALTLAQLEEKLKAGGVKLANLADGGYVDVKKYEDAKAELAAAENTVKELREAAVKFDGVDVDALKQKVTELEARYKDDLAAVKLNNAIDLELLKAKVKNAKLVKAALDTKKLRLEGDKPVGLSEQIEALKESDGYLFEEEKPVGATVSTGAHHTTSGNTDNFMTALIKGAGITKGE